MSTRELVFEYTTRGARSAAKADERVRDSVRKTGRTARRNAGAVERWMDRNRKAIQAVALAAGAAIGSILSASPTMRAQLGGVRTAFTLFSETIVNDVLPAGTNLGSIALDIVNWFRDLPDPIRRVISVVTVIAGVIGTAAVIFGTLLSVLAPVIKVVGAIVSAIAGLISIKVILIGIVIALAAALIFNVGGARDKVVSFFSDIWSRGKELFGKLWDRIKSVATGVFDTLKDWFGRARDRVIELAQKLYRGARDKLQDLLSRAKDIASRVRDGIVDRITDAKDRVLELLSLGREMAEKAKEWIGGLVDGVQDRAGELVDAFRDMASRVGQAFKDKFNDLIPSSISIPSVSVDIPDILGGGSVSVGGGSLSIPQLDTGGRIASDGLAMLHAGERIMPAAQVRERGPQPTGESGTTIEEINIMVMGTGDARTDGRNIAREFERELSDRGA